MTTTTSNRGVAREWLKHADAKSGNGNMSTHDGVLYSYSTPIANLVQPEGGEVALISTETYSVTTEGKHKNAAFHACHAHCYKPFRVPYLLLAQGVYAGRSRANSRARTIDEQHIGNLEHYAEQITQERARLARARVYTQRDTLNRLEAEAFSYASVFGLGSELVLEALERATA